jgi:hypothetical protein
MREQQSCTSAYGLHSHMYMLFFAVSVNSSKLTGYELYQRKENRPLQVPSYAPAAVCRALAE